MWFRIHPHAPAARLFEAYSQTLGAELVGLRFYRSGRRMMGSVPLIEQGVGDEDEVRDFPCTALANVSAVACEDKIAKRTDVTAV